MVLELMIGTRWWCECGWHCSPVAGAGQIIREHRMECSFANRRGERLLMDGWATGLQIRDGSGRHTNPWKEPPLERDPPFPTTVQNC